MRIARESRGAQASWTGHARAVATSAGALFVRSYERGERVYLAMASRGLHRLDAGARRRRDGPDVGDVPAVAGRGDARRRRRLGGAAVTAPGARRARPRVHLPRRARGPARRRSHRRRPASGSPSSGPTAPARRRSCSPSTASTRPTRGTVTVGGMVGRAGQPGRDPPPRRHRLPGSRRPAVHADGARRRRLRAGQPRRCAASSWRPARCEALDAVGMAHVADRSPHHLSFGERRRVALATVLAMRPDVLVLDEPSSNLDPLARRELAEIVARAARDDAARDPRPAVRPAAVRRGRWSSTAAGSSSTERRATSSPTATRWPPTAWSCRTASIL